MKVAWGIILAVAGAVPGFSRDCTPQFYQFLPRDQEWYYGVARDQDIDKARDLALQKLANQAGTALVAGWEQDDFAQCKGYSYVLVRVEKEKIQRALRSSPPASPALAQLGAQAGVDVKQAQGDLRAFKAEAIARVGSPSNPAANYLDGDPRYSKKLLQFKNATTTMALGDKINQCASKTSVKGLYGDQGPAGADYYSATFVKRVRNYILKTQDEAHEIVITNGHYKARDSGGDYYLFPEVSWGFSYEPLYRLETQSARLTTKDVLPPAMIVPSSADVDSTPVASATLYVPTAAFRVGKLGGVTLDISAYVDCLERLGQ